MFFSPNLASQQPHLVSNKKIINPYDSGKMTSYYVRPQRLYDDAIRHITSTLKIEKLFKSILDVGCGTGISTLALSELAQQIVGVDSAETMLRYAVQHPKVTYKQASAEDLPFPDSSFDLVSIFVAFHWTNQQQFLKEAARVLRDNGHLIICNFNFTGIETEQYQKWTDEIFFEKFPPLPGERNYVAAKHASADFPSVIKVKYATNIEMDLKELVQLHMTYGGVFHAVNKGLATPASVKAWLEKELAPFLQGQKTVPFKWDTSIWFIERVPRPALILASENEVKYESRSRIACRL